MALEKIGGLAQTGRILVNAGNEKPVLLQLGRGDPERSRIVKIDKARWPVGAIETDAVGGVGVRADIFEGRMGFGAP